MRWTEITKDQYEKFIFENSLHRVQFSKAERIYFNGDLVAMATHTQTRIIYEKIEGDLLEYHKCAQCGCGNFDKKKKGPHIGLYCAKCQTWKKWVNLSSDIWEFGKYKGKKIEQIEDQNYLRWALKNFKLSPYQRSVAEIQLKTLESNTQ